MAIMIGSMVLGGIQILTGMTISVVKKTRDGHFADACGTRSHGGSFWPAGPWRF